MAQESAITAEISQVKLTSKKMMKDRLKKCKSFCRLEAYRFGADIATVGRSLRDTIAMPFKISTKATKLDAAEYNTSTKQYRFSKLISKVWGLKRFVWPVSQPKKASIALPATTICDSSTMSASSDIPAPDQQEHGAPFASTADTSGTKLIFQHQDPGAF